MSIDFALSPVLSAAALLVMVLLAVWTYRRSVPAIPAGLRRLLVTIRVIVLFILLLLLAQPILTTTREVLHEPLTVVLVDDSQSAGLVEQEFGLDVASQVRDRLAAIEDAGLSGNVRFYGFSDDITDLGASAARASDFLRFGGTRTDISRAIAEVQRRHEGDNLRAAILISDGRFNAGRNPAYVAEEGTVPVYTIAVGDTAVRRDVQIRGVTTNELAYQGQEVPVRVSVQANGFEGQRARVTLLEGGEPRDEEMITLPADGEEQAVDLSFVPENAGLRSLTARVTRFEGEVTGSNNAEIFTIRVLDSRQQILLVSSGASPDLAAVRKLLSEDDNLEVVSRTQRAPGQFYEGALPDLASFDAVILSGYPGAAADVSTARRLAQAVTVGTPLLFILERGTNLDMVQSEFSEVLPVQLAAVRPGYVEAAFDPTPDGRLHPVLANAGTTESGWSSLPPLAFNESLWRASPDARVLATVRIRNLAVDTPLLVVRSRSGNRTAALLGAGTWRWQNLPEDLADLENLWPELFSNLIRWLSAREDDRRVRIEPVRELFDGQQPVEFTGQVYDESLEPVSDALIQLRIRTEEGSPQTFNMEPLGNGRYTFNAGILPTGNYRYIASASRGEQTVGDDSGSFVVGETAIEFKELQADIPSLRQTASRSGGQFIAEDRLSSLASVLQDRLVAQTRQMRSQLRLWHLPGFLIAVILLLALEWVLRKRAGMV